LSFAHWHSPFWNSSPYAHSFGSAQTPFVHNPVEQSLSAQQFSFGMHLLSHSFVLEEHSHLPSLHTCPLVQFKSLHKSTDGVSTVSVTVGWYSEVGTVCIAVSHAVKMSNKIKKYLAPIFDTTPQSCL
jgi:hypothetical protein